MSRGDSILFTSTAISTGSPFAGYAASISNSSPVTGEHSLSENDCGNLIDGLGRRPFPVPLVRPQLLIRPEIAIEFDKGWNRDRGRQKGLDVASENLGLIGTDLRRVGIEIKAEVAADGALCDVHAAQRRLDDHRVSNEGIGEF